jgi:hypothetical protein
LIDEHPESGGPESLLGRHCAARPGAVVGPGTVNLSTGVIEEFAFAARFSA